MSEAIGSTQLSELPGRLTGAPAYSFEELQASRVPSELKSGHLQLLHEFSQILVGDRGGHEALRLACFKLCTAVSCELAIVSAPDVRGQMPCVYAAGSAGSTCPLKEGDFLPDRINLALAHGKPVFCSKSSESGTAPTVGFSAECHVPLSRAGNAVGLLSLFWKRDSGLMDETRGFVSAVSRLLTIALERELALDQVRALQRQIETEKLCLDDELRSGSAFDEIIGRSPALRKVLRQIEMVAPTDSTVLVCGETGSGKELIARALHNLSPRSKAPFVKLNCAAMPPGLLESELFGHERGAYTGALSQRIGRFELANRGTIFLDEIGELPLDLQPKLLRVLQEREFERLGSSKTLSTDARLIAATNRDLSAMLAEGRFRSDLYYRLNVFPVLVPSLRQRKEDIPLLVRHFVRNLSRKMNKSVEAIPAETMDALMTHTWPGNIRELQNVLERAVILSPGKVLRLPVSDLQRKQQVTALREVDTLENIERTHILRALKATNGVIAGPRGAASLLGLKRSTLRARMERLGLQRASDQDFATGRCQPAEPYGEPSSRSRINSEWL